MKKNKFITVGMLLIWIPTALRVIVAISGEVVGAVASDTGIFGALIIGLFTVLAELWSYVYKPILATIAILAVERLSIAIEKGKACDPESCEEDTKPND